MKRRKLYHLTLDDHGPVLRVKRRRPSHPAAGEPATPRLCVCPTVAECFAARLLYPGPAHVYAGVYRGVSPRGVWDSFLTRERWLIPPCELRLEAVLDAARVEAATRLVRRYHEATRKRSNWRLRLVAMSEAAKAFPEFRARRILAELVEEFDAYRCTTPTPQEEPFQ